MQTTNKRDYEAEATGAVRESINTKIDTTLVPYELTACAAIGLNYGAEKYDARNFEKGLSYRTLCGSIERHNKALLDGEDYDAESGLPHVVLLASSIAMLCHNWMQGVVIDNRPIPKAGVNVSELAKMAQTYLDQRVSYVTQLPVGNDA